MNKDTLLYILFQIIHWSDWFVAGVYVWFIWVILMSAGVSYDTLLTMGDVAHWKWDNLTLVIFIIPLVCYTIFFPWSFFKKRREIYFSELSHPLNLTLAVYALIYIAYLTNFTPSSVKGGTYIGMQVLMLAGVFVELFALVTLLCVWVGGFWGFKIGWFWYRKFGIEPMTWEEAMRRYVGEE